MHAGLHCETARAIALPRHCAARLPSDGSPILIKRGERGHWPALGIDVEGFNKRHGVTAAQREAMEIGSCFGWDCPGANPANCDDAATDDELATGNAEMRRAHAFAAIAEAA